MSAHLLGATAALTGRSLRHVTRSPDTIVTTAVMPVAIMLLFVFVLGGAIDTGPRAGTGEYIDYVLPGVLPITVAMGVSYTAYRLFVDVRDGVFDRFDSMPISRSAALWAHVLTSLTANAVSLALVIGVALLLGARPSAGPLGWLAVTGILLLLVLVLTWVSVVAGLLAKSVEGASVFSYPLILLPFVSSAFVPTSSMPGPVRWFAEHQPMTPIVDTVRALLGSRQVGAEIWVALAWCLGTLAVAAVVAGAIRRRRVA